MIELELPWPPSMNHYKSVGRIIQTKFGKFYQPRFNTKATSSYFKEVWAYISQMKVKEGLKSYDSAIISLDLNVTLYPPDKRVRDVDNSLKVLLDSLVHAKLIHDDSQIVRLTVRRKEVFAPKGKVNLKLKELGNEI